MHVRYLPFPGRQDLTQTSKGAVKQTFGTIGNGLMASFLHNRGYLGDAGESDTRHYHHWGSTQRRWAKVVLPYGQRIL